MKQINEILQNGLEYQTIQKTNPVLPLVKRRFTPPHIDVIDDNEVDIKLKACGWYSLYLDSKWEMVIDEKIIKDMLKREYWDNNTNYPRGLFITGDIGVGKTSLLCLIARWFKKYFPITPHFVSTGMLFEKFFEKEHNEISMLMKASVLFIDDLGREYRADYPLSKFENFIEYRYGNLLPTFISSNIKIEDINKRDGFERISSRINDPKWMIHLTYAGKDKRVRI